MSDYPMLISNKLHSFRNFRIQKYKKGWKRLVYVGIKRIFAALKLILNLKDCTSCI